MTEDNNVTIRIKRTPKGAGNPYFMSLRSTAQDDSISWEASGVLHYLLSKPDDWELRPSDLKKRSGKHKTYRILRELIDAGYIVRHEHREKGRIVAYTYDVYETPYPDFLDTVNLEADLPHTENRDITEYRGLESTERDNRDKDSIALDAPTEKPKSKKPVTPKPVKEKKPPAHGLDAETFQLYKQAIMNLFGVTEARVFNLLTILRGCATKAGYKPYNLTPAVDLEELADFVYWYRQQHPNINIPTSPEKLNDYIVRFRDTLKAKVLANEPPPANIFQDYSHLASDMSDDDLDAFLADLGGHDE